MAPTHPSFAEVPADDGRLADKTPTRGKRAALRSLRVRVTLALLVTGLTSAAVVGVVARTVVLGRINRLLLDASFERFQGDVAAYVSKYGSWDAGVQRQAFGEFSRDRHAGDAQNAGFGSVGQLPPVRDGQQDHRMGAPPLRGPGIGPRGALPGAPMGAGPMAAVAAFRFVLLDAAGDRVLLGPKEYLHGRPLDAAQRSQARPIRVDGKTVGLAVPLHEPNYSAYDDGYLSAMQSGMLYGVGTAALLALGLGVFFGERLSRNVRALTEALGAMGKGELRQRVDVRSRDEVGVMADAFNRMSVDLAESHAQIRAQAALLKELSIRDDLTGLHNRRHFDEQAAHAFARARRYGQPLTVMICDVDHFKRVNDQYSHAVGDAVLAQLGRLLRSTTRESDIVARYGGEEFVVVFPQTTAAQATALCERIRERIEGFNWSATHADLRITMSMGLDGDESRASIDAMLVAADARMYEAKAAGRNRLVSEPALAGRARSA